LSLDGQEPVTVCRMENLCRSKPDRLYVTPSQLWKSFDPVAFRAFKWHRRPRPWIARRMRMPHREFSDAVRQPPGCKSKL